MDPRNIVKFSAKPELLVDSAVDEEVQGRIDSQQEVADLGDSGSSGLMFHNYVQHVLSR